MGIEKYLAEEVEHLRRLRQIKALSFYLDTSLPDALYQNEEQLAIPYNKIRAKSTKEFWGMLERQQFSAQVSRLYFEEIENAPEPKRSNLISIVSSLLSLEITEEIEKLAHLYLRDGILPERKLYDATHLAAATVYKADGIVSWNFEDMIKVKTIKNIRKINKLQGLGETITVITPIEILRVYKDG